MTNQNQQAQPENDRQDAMLPRRFGPLDYLIVNAVFLAFCVLAFATIKAYTGEQIGLYFFFGVMVIGFIIVSAFSYVFDVLAEDQTDSTSSSPGQPE